MSESENSSTAASQSQCDELAAAVLRYCEANHFKIAAAESLTGGLLADAFVRIPGASKVFLGSAVTYDIRAKAKILGVNAPTCWPEKGRSTPKWRGRWLREPRNYTDRPRMETVSSAWPLPVLQGQDRMVTNLPAWCTSAAPCPVASMAFVRVKQLLMSCV